MPTTLKDWRRYSQNSKRRPRKRIEPAAPYPGNVATTPSKRDNARRAWVRLQVCITQLRMAIVRGSRYSLTTPCADGRGGGGSEFPLFAKASYPTCCSMKSAIIYIAPFAGSTAKRRMSPMLEGAPSAQLPRATLWLGKNRLSIRSTLIGLIFGASKREARTGNA